MFRAAAQQMRHMLSSAAAPAAAQAPSAFPAQTVSWVHHWTPRLFSFRCARDPGFRFLAGQFAMIGLTVAGKPLLRAYSMVSPPWDDELEFLSIKVEDGPLTSRLQHVRPGDPVLVGRKPTGTLLLDNLAPGRTLWLLATGTGVAPFLSVIREPETYARFERVVLVHTVRLVAELAYRDLITRELPDHELLGEEVRAKLMYYPSVTREAFPTQARITTLFEGGRVFADLGLPAISPVADRAMLCGSEEMNADVSALLRARGFTEGSQHEAGSYVVEKAFVEK